MRRAFRSPSAFQVQLRSSYAGVRRYLANEAVRAEKVDFDPATKHSPPVLSRVGGKFHRAREEMSSMESGHSMMTPEQAASFDFSDEADLDLTTYDWARYPLEEPVQLRAMPADASSVTLKLSPTEERLFAAVRGCIAKYELGTTIRVAGGWVRDKLMGRESDDIDFACDNMSGATFAQHLCHYVQEELGEETTRVAIIKSNSEKSKHLETATFKVFGIEVDANNLRTEVYHEDSRIPVAEFGTAHEDAERRDFTVNAMYYNVNLGCVEDLLNRSIADMQNGVLVTPTDPAVTFRDDPLRVLRAVRFACRFGFRCDESLIAAADCDRTRRDLDTKVTRERFCKELDKMIVGPGAPLRAMGMLCQFGVFDTVFRLPEEGIMENDLPDPKFAQRQGLRALKIVSDRLDEWQKQPAWHARLTKDMRRHLLLAAFLSPYAHLSYRPKLTSTRTQHVAVHMLQQSLRFSKHTAAVTSKFLESATYFAERVQPECSPQRLASLSTRAVRNAALRKHFGRWLRVIGEEWEPCLLLAKVLMQIRNGEIWHEHDIREVENWLRLESDLLGCWKWRPLVDGKELVKDYGVAKGPEVKNTIDAILDWQYENPHATKKQCAKWLSDYLSDDATHPMED
ncbi:MAG: hypothetical protein MHM6MM_007509 [Cercozoa sp. M6MM]